MKYMRFYFKAPKTEEDIKHTKKYVLDVYTGSKVKMYQGKEGEELIGADIPLVMLPHELHKEVSPLGDIVGWKIHEE